MGNSELAGRIVRLMPYGVFVKLDEGKVGLVHISQFEESPETVPEEPLKEGDRVVVKIAGYSKGGKLNLEFIKKIDGKYEERPKAPVRENFELKLKKFLKESQESQTAYNKRIKRHRRMAA